MFGGDELEKIAKNFVTSLVLFGVAIGLAIGFACLAIYMAVT